MKDARAETQSQHFEIRIRGHLSELRSDSFEDMQTTKLTNGETLISGEIEDQAQLFGLLIRIRDLGIPLLEINCCPTKIENNRGDSK